MLKRNMTRPEVENVRNRGIKDADGSTIAPILDTFYLDVDVQDHSVGRNLASSGFWEAWITAWATRVVQPDWHCMDIGANFGYYTGILAHMAKSVIAFEPNPTIFARLENSVKINGWDNVTLVKAGVGEKTRTETLTMERSYQGSASLLLGEDYFRRWGKNIIKYEVLTRPLDAWHRYDNKRVDFIKIDVEGFEPQVFAGGSLVLSDKPLIAIEITPDHPTEFLDMLFSDYAVTQINHQGGESPISRTDIVTNNWWMLALRSKD